MAQVLSGAVEWPQDVERGLPDRRLTDRILDAFSHAYGTGCKEVAETLLDALASAERDARNGLPERRQSNALTQADRWIAFVDARDDYNRICGIKAGAKAGNRASSERALTRMKAAYMHWSESVPAN